VFEGYGVGLTVAPLGPVAGAELLPPGVPGRPSRFSEVFPRGSRSPAETARELERIQEHKAVLAAYEAHLVMDLAAHRPEAVDRQPGEPGRGVNALSPIPGTSEFFVDELAVVTNSSVKAAGRLAEQSYVLVGQLPRVWAALADGELDLPRARVFVEVLGSARPGVAVAVAEESLPAAAGLSLGRLRARLRRAVLAVDEEFAECCRVQAERAADVRLRSVPEAGMSELSAEMPAPLAAACWSTVDELAWMAKNDGDARPIGQVRAGVLADLILRPWDASRPAVTAQLTVLAPLASLAAPDGVDAAREPGEVNGQPITAAHVRELLEQLDAVCPGGLQVPTGGSLQMAVADADGALLTTTDRRELEQIARRGCPEHASGPARPPEATTQDTTGIGTPSGCDCPVLRRPAAVDRYVRSAAQRRFVKTRDRTCRQPNCGQPVGRVDLDHVRAYGDGGPTDCDNLCCLCRRHHRLKTHARGWRFVLTEHGVLRVTTPSGITRTTRPPGLRDRIEQRALPAPPPPPAPPDEPPPF
jgi:hypothetical protein